MTVWQKFAIFAAALLLASLPASVVARRAPRRAAALLEDPTSPDPTDNSPKLSAEKSGVILTKDGRSLRLNVERGNVRVYTDASGRISYHAAVQVDSGDPGAQEFLQQFNFTARQMPWGVAFDGKVPWQGLHGRFSATIDIHVPRRYNVEVTTGGGNIEVQDINGHVKLTSAGGNINVGCVGAVNEPDRSVAAYKRDRLTLSSPMVVASIETQGGHITVGDVAGTLRATTSGGHITAGNIAGDAVLRTGGGQISVKKIAGAAALDSGGGNIHLQGAASRVTADTAGGGLVLRQASAPLRVSASSGGITAWINNDGSGAKDAEESGPRQASQLFSTGGDIVMYIPSELAATIDAIVEQGNGHRVATDPSLPVRINCHDSEDVSRTIHCAGLLHGGGELFHLKTVSGNIVLRLDDPEIETRAASAADLKLGGLASSVLEPMPSDDEEFADPDGFFAEIRRRILESWWGGIPVDAAEMQKHLVHSVAPVYPEVARQAGVEGDVVLRVNVSSAGRVTELRVLDGPPILARAAVQAVQQWQYQAPRMDGQPANVVTTLVVSFRLH